VIFHVAHCAQREKCPETLALKTGT